MLSVAVLVQVASLLKGRPTLEALAPVLEWDPAPVGLPGWQRLKDGAQAGWAWRERARPLLDPCAPAELAAVEALALEASRLPVHLPEAKVGGALCRWMPACPCCFACAWSISSHARRPRLPGEVGTA